MYMKRKILIVFLSIILFILLFPIRLRESDGGTVSYVAVLYSISHVNRLNVGTRGEKTTLTKGTIVKIAGQTVYDSTQTFLS